MWSHADVELWKWSWVFVWQNDEDKLCLICHEDMRRSGGGVQELHCSHRFHKEVKHLTLHVSSTLCLHRPDFPIARQSLHVQPNPSMSHLRPAVHAGCSFLNMHDVKRDENNPPAPETLSVEGQLTDRDVSVWWLLKAARRSEESRPRSGSEAATCQVRRPSDERRKSADGPIYMQKEQQTPRRQLSLRRHRWYHSVEGGDSSVEQGRMCSSWGLQEPHLNSSSCGVQVLKSRGLDCAKPDPVKLLCGSNWRIYSVFSSVPKSINQSDFICRALFIQSTVTQSALHYKNTHTKRTKAESSRILTWTIQYFKYFIYYNYINKQLYPVWIKKKTQPFLELLNIWLPEVSCLNY